MVPQLSLESLTPCLLEPAVDVVPKATEANTDEIVCPRKEGERERRQDEESS